MRLLHNRLALVVFGIGFRILLLQPVLPWLGTPADHFQGNEPSHIAAHLVRGDGFASPFTDLPIPTAQQAPLYPLFMAGIFELFGVFSKASLYVILGANCIAGGLTALFIYRAGVRYLSALPAAIAAWSWALLPPIAVTDLTLSSYAFAALAVVLWLNFVGSFVPQIRYAVSLGAIAGIMLLLNPMLVLLVPASVLWINKKQALVVLGTALLVTSPWYVRNYKVMGHFYPALRDNLGMELYLGNHPGMSGTCDYWTGESPYGSELPKLGEARFFEIRGKEALAYINAAPKEFMLRSIRRFARFWFSPWPPFYVILLILALWGMRSVPRSVAVFAGTLFISYPLVFYVTQAAWPTAYRHPIEPMMLLMAAASMCRFGSGFKIQESEVRAGKGC